MNNKQNHRGVKMKVILVNYTPEPQQAIVNATRTCYQSYANQSDSSDEKLLKHVIKNNESPLEFANFTFLVSGISRITSHQIVRHRIASYAQKSQRYCKEEDFNYVTPPLASCNIKDDDVEERSIFSKAMVATQTAYNALLKLGVKPEDARYVLPGACATELICSLNARSLRHFIKLRSSPRSQWEIRQVAEKMKQEVFLVAPLLVGGL